MRGDLPSGTVTFLFTDVEGSRSSFTSSDRTAMPERSPSRWYEAHREQFERTERHYEERKAAWELKAAAKCEAREVAAEDAA